MRRAVRRPRLAVQRRLGRRTGAALPGSGWECSHPGGDGRRPRTALPRRVRHSLHQGRAGCGAGRRHRRPRSGRASRPRGIREAARRRRRGGRRAPRGVSVLRRPAPGRPVDPRLAAGSSPRRARRVDRAERRPPGAGSRAWTRGSARGGRLRQGPGGSAREARGGPVSPRRRLARPDANRSVEPDHVRHRRHRYQAPRRDAPHPGRARGRQVDVRRARWTGRTIGSSRAGWRSRRPRCGSRARRWTGCSRSTPPGSVRPSPRPSGIRVGVRAGPSWARRSSPSATTSIPCWCVQRPARGRADRAACGHPLLADAAHATPPWRYRRCCPGPVDDRRGADVPAGPFRHRVRDQPVDAHRGQGRPCAGRAAVERALPEVPRAGRQSRAGPRRFRGCPTWSSPPTRRCSGTTGRC